MLFELFFHKPSDLSHPELENEFLHRYLRHIDWSPKSSQVQAQDRGIWGSYLHFLKKDYWKYFYCRTRGERENKDFLNLHVCCFYLRNSLLVSSGSSCLLSLSSHRIKL